MTKLSEQETTLWAKKRDEDGEALWLPLIVHLLDTQNTINWLFNHWLSDGQRQLLTTTLSEADAQKLVKFLGFSHDIGKATPAFQTKPAYGGAQSLDAQLMEQLIRGGFAKLNDLYLASGRKSPHALAGEAILEKLGVPQAIGAIIGGHHGKPTSFTPIEQLDDYTANYWQSDTQKQLQVPWQKAQRQLFEYALTSSGYQAVSDLPVVNQPMAVILEGLLIMADWLASSEYMGMGKDAPLFPLISLDQAFEDVAISARFHQAMTTWYLGGQWEPQHVLLADDPYEARFGFHPRPVQAQITQAIAAASDPGLAIIEAPMGLGKTEIALLAAEQLAYTKGRNGVFMGLPTQATTNAMFDRVTDWLTKLATTQSENFPIKLMHGKAAFNETFHDLPNAANVDNVGAVVVNSWFSGKKSILTNFTVGTIDNLLLMGLKQKHLFLKHLGFSGKVVIIDEVHAYDVYMNQYLYKAIEWLGAYQVPIVILSATLPKAKRNELLTAYLRGKFGRKYKKDLKAPVGWQETQAYPLLSLLDGQEIKQVSEFTGQSDQPPLTLQVQRLTETDEALMAGVLAKISAGGVAGVIVNTVKRAQALAKLVPGDVPLMVLHSAFLATDRAAQEKALQAAIGKHGQRPAKLIVIGTQVLEQSLDIDFDVLYTDIAPMDLILQRAGRLHRHQIARPQALQTPQLFIMGVKGAAEFDDGSEAVYGKYLLMKTTHFLKDHIALPQDISQLVQQVYEPATDEEIVGIEPAKLAFSSYLEKEEQKARIFQVKSPDFGPRATLHGWLDRAQADVDKDDQKASAAVRDIRETLEVILVQHKADGDYLLDSQKLSDVRDQAIAQQVIRLPVALTPRIDQAIDYLENLTSRYFADWQDSIWLKGALALPLDQNMTTQFGDWQLTYGPKLGLSYVKEADDGSKNL